MTHQEHIEMLKEAEKKVFKLQAALTAKDERIKELTDNLKTATINWGELRSLILRIPNT